ncbi:MAG: DUF4249 domain-containing protein [Tenuifilaceae bacterium]|jgi:hypothetical protein|nr:DUF4249 domain-containing protein [Tenuifilaceae bacterium]
MKANIRRRFILLFAAPLCMGLFSCIDDVDNLNLPDSSPKLVVQSFISPGDSIKVAVRSSKPYNYNTPQVGDSWEFEVISSSAVIIRDVDMGIEQSIPFKWDKSIFAIPPEDFTISPGHQYELIVRANGFNDVIATTRVPDYSPSVTNVKVEATIANEWGEYSILAAGTIEDTPATSNSYAVYLYQYTIYTNENIDYTYPVSQSRMLLTDNLRNGENINFRVTMNAYYSYGEGERGETEIVVLSTDEHYYRFHKSLEGIYDIMDNPFAESAHLYSNMEGGLGIFASFVYIFDNRFSK